MKVNLMYRDQDFILDHELPQNKNDLIQDLELKTVFSVMANRDDFVYKVAQTSILSSLDDIETILYRQAILQDCLNYPDVIREMYQIPIDVTRDKQKSWLGIFTHSPSGVLYSAVQMMTMLVDHLKHLKRVADQYVNVFTSEGFTTFFKMIKGELSDEYFRIVDNHLKQLRFRDGVLISLRLGPGSENIGHVLRLPNQKTRKKFKDILIPQNPVYSFMLSERDNAGARALSDLKDIAVNSAANSLAQATEHIENFFNTLKTEIAFYIGCINLKEQLVNTGNQFAFPIPYPTFERKHSFREIYDISLALTMKKKIIGNELWGDNKDIFIITGANQGGKSTFLRSIGLTQLMMQAGMFVPAEKFEANLCEGVFTHYRRKEDATMKSGKLDEELSRMSDIVNLLKPNSIVLFNESFAATNEREGSEIARQITKALLDRKIKVFFVTHMYEFARIFYESQNENFSFLRAERKPGGKRSYKLLNAEPLPTSYGIDLFTSLFKENDSPTPANKSSEIC